MSDEHKTPAVSAELRDMVARAQDAARVQRELRKAEPNGVSTARRAKSIPQEILCAKYAKRDGFDINDAPSGYHYMFGSRLHEDEYPDRGYEPIVDKGKQVSYKGDKLWKIPMDLYEDILREPVEIDKQRMFNQTTEEAAAADAGLVVSRIEGSAKPGTKEFEQLQKELE